MNETQKQIISIRREISEINEFLDASGYNVNADIVSIFVSRLSTLYEELSVLKNLLEIYNG